jgi:DNA topoisomerase-2
VYIKNFRGGNSKNFPPPKFVKDVLATGVLTDLVALGQARLDKELKKTDGAKKSRITGVPKLDDANWAGTHRSHECTLIITEGDSAKALAIAGLSVVGRDRYGVFPSERQTTQCAGRFGKASD